jgi:hypothetical protein
VGFWKTRETFFSNKTIMALWSPARNPKHAPEAGLAVRVPPPQNRAGRRRRRFFLAPTMFFAFILLIFSAEIIIFPVESQQAPSILILA